MRTDSKATGQLFWTVLLTLSMCMLMKQEVHGQWFEHRLQVAGTSAYWIFQMNCQKKTDRRFIWKSMNGAANLNFLFWNPSAWLRNQAKEKSFRFRSG